MLEKTRLLTLIINMRPTPRKIYQPLLAGTSTIFLRSEITEMGQPREGSSSSGEPDDSLDEDSWSVPLD